MELVVKHYSELTADELYDILHVRVLVFVVEQKCPYEEVDGRDRQAYHVFLRDETGIKAYLRVLDRGVSFEEVSIGRVLTTERRRGYGHKILDDQNAQNDTGKLLLQQSHVAERFVDDGRG